MHWKTTMTYCKCTTMCFNKDDLSEKSLGKLHSNSDAGSVSVLLLFYTLHQLSFTCVPSFEGRKYLFHANEFCKTPTHICSHC